jgi:L-fuculose-phosphate aldolase
MNNIVFWGKKVVKAGLCTSFFGNISYRNDNKIFITKTGAMLDKLADDDIVEVNVIDKSSSDKIASSELVVHREIYQKTHYDHVIHTHSLFSTLMDKFEYYVSFDYSEVLPFLKKVPIVTGKSGTSILAKNVSEALNENPVVIVKGHGVFSAGQSFKECYIYLTALEHYSKDKYFRELLNE